MTAITMEHIHEDIIIIKEELAYLRSIIDENYELAEDVINDIKESKNRSPKQRISHEEMRKEFGE